MFMRAGSFSPPGKDHLCATFILIKMAEDSQKELQWSDDRVLDLIYEIEQLPLLWDPRDKEKKNRNKKNDAFKSLADKFGVTAEEIRKKYLNLLQAYRNCRRKIKNSKLSGAALEQAVFTNQLGLHTKHFTNLWKMFIHHME